MFGFASEFKPNLFVMRKKTYYFALMLFLFFQKVIAQPELVTTIPINSYGNFEALGSLYFFDKDSIWISDGTAGGTTVLKDLGQKGVAFFRAGRIVSVGYELSTTFLFFAKGTAVTSLWRSNGSPGGTVSIASYDYVKPLGVLNNEFYYGALSGSTSRLYKIGNTGSPVLLKTVNLEPYSKISSNLQNDFDDHEVIGNILYFRVNGDGPAAELWKTNGTVGGTVKVKDTPEVGFAPNFTNVNGTLFFAANGLPVKLWKSNGTSGGTVVVKSFAELFNTINSFAAYKNKLLFVQNSLLFDNSFLYTSDGTANGTNVIKELPYGGQETGIVQAGIVNDQQAFFNISLFEPAILFRSDATPSGTILVKETPAYGFGEFAVLSDYVFFSNPLEIDGDPQLWQSDLTSPNTEPVKNLFPGTDFPASQNLVNVNEILYFATIESGIKKLWKYNPNVPLVQERYFTVVNAQTDQDRGLLRENDTIVKYQQETINIRYNPLVTPGSVKFFLNGSFLRTENEAPFALAGDDGGNYNPWLPSNQGFYTIITNEYSGNNGTGTLIGADTITFFVQVINYGPSPVANAGSDKTITLPTTSTTLNGSASAPGGSIVSTLWSLLSKPGDEEPPVIANPSALSTNVTGFYLPGQYVFRLAVTNNKGITAYDEINVNVTGQLVYEFRIVEGGTSGIGFTIDDGDTVDLASYNPENLNFEAVTIPSPVGSVRFNYDGTIRTENQAPYAFYGDIGGVYNGGPITTGNHTLSAVPYTGSGATGSAGLSKTISFRVVNGASVLRTGNTSSSIVASCYPNPSSGNVNIALSMKEDVYSVIQIYDSQGNEVEKLYEGEVVNGSDLNFVWNSGHKSGLYFLKVKTGNKEYTEKIVIH